MFRVKKGRNNSLAFLQIKDSHKKVKKSIRTAWYKVGKDAVKEAREAVKRRDKDGRLYVRKGSRRRASSIGQSHANQSGKLINSIGYSVSQSSMKFGYGADGKTPPRYAGFVELGTKRMGARPTAGNAANAVKRNSMQHFTSGFIREFRQ